MDLATLALTVATLLAKKALEGAGTKAGEGAWAALGRIADTVRSRFRGDQEATDALERLEARPASQGRIQELAEMIEDRFAAEPSFATELADLVEHAKAEPQMGAFVVTIQDNAQVGKITNIGHVTGDIHF